MDKYITVILHGGLGNCLFQISSAMGIARDQNRILILTSPSQQLRHQTVRDFNEIIKVPVISDIQFEDTFLEPDGHFSEHYLIPNPCGNLQLEGYFQNERYFDHHREEILKLFSMPDNTRTRLQSKYLPDDFYFFHVRRGDYVNNPPFWYQPHTYWRNAVKYILDRNPIARFMIFSNDINYCKRDPFFQGISAIFIEGEDEVQSLYLMSLCRKGGVVANSTYSWWGAYLNENPEKLVIFPDIWHNVYNVVEIYPTNAVILPCRDLM